jgi:hypothetical protein
MAYQKNLNLIGPQLQKLRNTRQWSRVEHLFPPDISAAELAEIAAKKRRGEPLRSSRRAAAS